jgi:hypothetical protein
MQISGVAFDSQSMYGTAPQMPNLRVVENGMQQVTSDDIGGGWQSLVNPKNPLLWVGGLLAVTIGLVGVAGSVRLGGAKVSASVGKG